jgi:hypothetical protein
MTDTNITPVETNPWQTVRAPRMLYLPTVAGDGGFKDSGLRVEVEDKVELKTGSNEIRVNGVAHRMLISCDKLRIVDGVIHLDKPQAPRPLSAGGMGGASVGRTGQAQANARNNWDHSAFAQKTGSNYTPPPPRTVTGGKSSFQVIHDETPAFGHVANPVDFDREIQDHFGKPTEPVPDPRTIDERFATEAHYAEITLKDGTQARVLVDPETGRHIGTPFRMYQATYDAEGHQEAAPAPTHGPNPSYTEADYQNWVAEQRANSVIAPSTPQPNAHSADPALEAPLQATATAPTSPPSPHDAQAPISVTATVVEPSAFHTGYLHLDHLIGGWAVGSVSHLYGPPEATDVLIEAAGGDACDSIETAFGRIHLAAAHPKAEPVVFVKLNGTITDHRRLVLAEELPVLIDMVSAMPVAVVITTPDWDETNMPALIRFLATRVHITPHERDPERFLTANITKHPTMTGKDISFPKATEPGR